MELTAVPFGITDWSSLDPVTHPGVTGNAVWRTCQFGTTRVRPTTGVGAGTSCCALRASYTPSWRMAASSR
jgi:hypothetical protein